MDKLVTALAPVFAAGFAVQQFLEILTSILNLDTKPAFQNWKKVILGLVSLVIGFALTFGSMRCEFCNPSLSARTVSRR